MLLTLTTTHQPATDLGYLLRKNPARPQSFSLTFGRAHVFYPEASTERCTVALLVEVDPVGLVRNRRGPRGEGGALEQYVNDRPYAASSFLSVAIAEVFGSALAGGHRFTTGRQVPFCLFTDPEFARIGLSETEAKARNIPYRLAKIPMIANLRARTLSKTRGFMKALIDAKTDTILGFTVLGVNAGEILAAVQ